MHKLKIRDNSGDFSPDEFNNFFASSGVTKPVTLIMPDVESFPSGFEFKPCRPSAVVHAVIHIKSNAVGVDRIPMKFIKNIFPIIA